MKRYEEIK
jgi:WS/DGAT C-terminal domain